MGPPNMTRADLAQMAQAAGFGANLRNTHAVKLELFAVAVRRKAFEDAAGWAHHMLVEMAEAGAPGEAVEAVADLSAALGIIAGNVKVTR